MYIEDVCSVNVQTVKRDGVCVAKTSAHHPANKQAALSGFLFVESIKLLIVLY